MHIFAFNDPGTWDGVFELIIVLLVTFVLLSFAFYVASLLLAFYVARRMTGAQKSAPHGKGAVAALSFFIAAAEIWAWAELDLGDELGMAVVPILILTHFATTLLLALRIAYPPDTRSTKSRPAAKKPTK